MQDIDFNAIEHVTVVAPDNLIIVNRVALTFEFQHTDNLHAVQWDGVNEIGHIEYTDAPNKELAKADYKKEVLPFIKAFQSEYPRKEQEELEAQEAAEREYNSEDSRFSRLRAERDKRIAATDYLLSADYPISQEKLEAVKAYRQALRDLPSQDGAPWDGGAEQTPWPAITW